NDRLLAVHAVCVDHVKWLVGSHHGGKSRTHGKSDTAKTVHEEQRWPASQDLEWDEHVAITPCVQKPARQSAAPASRLSGHAQVRQSALRCQTPFLCACRYSPRSTNRRRALRNHL